MFVAASTVEYLKRNRLVITTAESCTAEKLSLCFRRSTEVGHILRVVMSSIRGALDDSPANVAIATTGILGPDVIDGIPSGTVCFAWAYRIGRGLSVFSRKERFMGSRQEVQLAASLHALQSLPHFHQLAMAGEGA